LIQIVFKTYHTDMRRFFIAASLAQIDKSGNMPLRGLMVDYKRSIGPGCATTEEITASGRVRWQIGGSSSPGALFSISIQGE